LIYNGIDLDDKYNDHNLKDKLLLSEKDRASLIIGTTMYFKRSKGYEYLVEAAKSVCKKDQNIKFVCVGGGDRASIEKLVEMYHLKNNFIFTGHRYDVPSLLSIMDIFVFPSYSEGLPRAVMEAMAEGKPIVVADVGGSNELIVNQESGLIVQPKNAQALGYAIEYLIDNPQKAKQMGDQARLRVETLFNAQLNAKKYGELYLKLLGING
jgi:glycosyltransferase involved in cell wall biosynthesis